MTAAFLCCALALADAPAPPIDSSVAELPKPPAPDPDDVGIADLDRFPDKDTAADGEAYWLAAADWLETTAVYQPDNFAAETLLRARACRRRAAAWNRLYWAIWWHTPPGVKDCYARDFLRELRALIGPEAYRAGRMP